MEHRLNVYGVTIFECTGTEYVYQFMLDLGCCRARATGPKNESRNEIFVVFVSAQDAAPLYTF
jgi:hypothetical protein